MIGKEKQLSKIMMKRCVFKKQREKLLKTKLGKKQILKQVGKNDLKTRW